MGVFLKEFFFDIPNMCLGQNGLLLLYKIRVPALPRDVYTLLDFSLCIQAWVRC